LKEKTRRIRSELLPKYPNLIREAKGKISPFSIRLFVSDRQEQVMQEVQALAMECFSPHNPAAWDRGWFESGASYDSNIGFQPPARAEYTDASWSEGIDDPISKID
ncbi:MAG TPA: hypothetical protein VLF94_06035, partial [Chlamydiales bacterium]|nr:hypothetical protein [Chlamydiales bacterium]